jgi:hypothetical protein
MTPITLNHNLCPVSTESLKLSAVKFVREMRSFLRRVSR